jgi:hypothetical protein
MSTEGTPPPIPTGPPAAAPVFPLTEIGPKARAQWWLTILPTHLALADAPGGQPYVILRQQMMNSVIFMEGLRSLALKEPRKVNLQLTREGAKAVAEWIGRPFLASFYLNRRYRMLLPWAVVWTLGSLMPLLPGLVSARALFDPMALVLGLVLFGMWGVAKWRPHPILFLMDAIWFLCVAVRLASHILYLHQSKGWFVIVVLLLWGAVTGVMHFVRFRKTRVAPLGSQP